MQEESEKKKEKKKSRLGRPDPRPLTPYEQQRDDRIRANEAYLESLGLGAGKTLLGGPPPKPARKPRVKPAIPPAPTRRSSRIEGNDKPNYKEDNLDHDRKRTSSSRAAPPAARGKTTSTSKPSRRLYFSANFPVGSRNKSDLLGRLWFNLADFCRRHNFPWSPPRVDLGRQVVECEWWCLLVSNCNWRNDGTVEVEEVLEGKWRVRVMLSKADGEAFPDRDSLRRSIARVPVRCVIYSFVKDSFLDLGRCSEVGVETRSDHTFVTGCVKTPAALLLGEDNVAP